MAKGNDLLIAFDGDTGSLKVMPVLDVGADDIETKDGIYRLADAKQYVDTNKSRIVYMINVDVPAKIEAANLRLLRRSTALKTLFKFERNTKGDPLRFFPYIIIALLIFFK